jgi:hypothetical protein
MHVLSLILNYPWKKIDTTTPRRSGSTDHEAELDLSYAPSFSKYLSPSSPKMN